MEKITKAKQDQPASKHLVWDCGSSLYDSFELKALEKQLSSAIASRTLSMPHLTDGHRLAPPQTKKKPTSKILRSVHRLVRSVFKPNHSSKINNSESDPFAPGFVPKEGFYVIYDKPGALSTIPEVPEREGFSPEIKSLVRRSKSDRFSSAATVTKSVGTYCMWLITDKFDTSPVQNIVEISSRCIFELAIYTCNDLYKNYNSIYCACSTYI